MRHSQKWLSCLAGGQLSVCLALCIIMKRRVGLQRGNNRVGICHSLVITARGWLLELLRRDAVGIEKERFPFMVEAISSFPSPSIYPLNHEFYSHSRGSCPTRSVYTWQSLQSIGEAN